MRTLLAIACLGITACASRAQKAEDDRAQDRQLIESQLQSEMSLKADRAELNEVRADVPEDKQKQNDELALYLNLVGKGTEPPSEIREKFSRLVAKRRASFRDKVEKLRSDYRAEETKRREDFTKTAQKKRDRYFIKKRDAKASATFMSEQEKERLRVAAEERERRQSFEAELNVRSRDFDSYMRERTNEFNDRMRLYSKTYYDQHKDTKAVTSDDFRKMDELPTKPLGAGE